MPFYDYKCLVCSKVYTLCHKITEEIHAYCDECPPIMGNLLEKQIGTPMFDIRGDGVHDPGVH